MRKSLWVALLAAMVCVGGVAKDARATVTFLLEWVATTGAGVTGSNAIDALPGDVLTLAIRMTNDELVSGHGVSLEFDVDLGNELNLLNPNGGKNWSGTTYGTATMSSTYSEFAPVGDDPVIESTGATAGLISSFNGGAPFQPSYLPTGTYTIGTARFVASVALNDGADVFVGLFGINNVVLDSNVEPLPESSLVFGSASVNMIPEPGTASLLGLGLIGLLLAARRSRRT